MKNRIMFSLLLIFLLSFHAKSQEYINSVGIRAGLTQGITFKHFVTTTDAVDAILATGWGGFYITGLYERHTGAFDVDHLYFYYGAGAHVGFWEGTGNPWLDKNRGYTVFGIDGVIGLEYIFQEIPFNIALDWKPAFNLLGATGFRGEELALSFRFMF